MQENLAADKMAGGLAKLKNRKLHFGGRFNKSSPKNKVKDLRQAFFI